MERRTNEEKFRALWGRLAETGGVSKRVVWRELHLGVDTYDNYCPACNEGFSRAGNLPPHYDPVCNFCPLIWTGNRFCSDFRGLYRRWHRSTVWKGRMRLAAKIAKLPWREVGR